MRARCAAGLTLASAIVLTSMSAGCSGAATSAKATSSQPSTAVPAEQAVTAASVADSVGVVVHMSYTDTGYNDAGTVLSLLTRLGVRHVRDAVVPGSTAGDAGIKLLAAAGVRFDLLAGAPASAGSAAVSPGIAAELTGPLNGTYDMVEEPNEYDCSGDANWATTLHAYNANLLKVLANAHVTAPLLAPSFCRTGDDKKFATLAATGAIANAHPYAGGVAPEFTLDAAAPAAKAVAGGASVIFSEDGYHTATHDGSQPRVSEATQADYTLRTLLEAKRLGVSRNYLYELLDEKPDPSGTNQEEHFGLVRSDGSVKPAFTAVQNLVGDLAAGASTTVSPAAPLPVQIVGGGSLLRHLLVARPDGTYALALWLADTREDATTHAQLPDDSSAVQVQTSGTFVGSSQQPSRGNAVTTLGTGSSFTVNVNGAPTLVNLSPSISPALVHSPSSAAATPATYTTRQHADGAVLVAPLSSSLTASGVPSSQAASGPAGRRVAGKSSVTLLKVPGAPQVWTIELWEMTARNAASGSIFLQAAGLHGAQLRAYDMVRQPSTHKQISAYGLPPRGSRAAWGAEMFGQALPGTWHHVALVNDGRTVSLYVDGVRTGRVPGAPARLTGLQVGAVSPGWRGALAGLAAYPRALTGRVLLAHATAADAYSHASQPRARRGV